MAHDEGAHSSHLVLACVRRPCHAKVVDQVSGGGSHHGGLLERVFYVELLNPILPLEQLTKNEGVLVQVYKPLRTAHNSAIRILTDSGEEIAYRGSIYNEAALLAAKGKRVTVWSQPYYKFWWPFYFEEAWQVQEGEQVLISYENTYKGLLRYRTSDEWLAKHLLILTILSLAIVALACHKGATSE